MRAATILVQCDCFSRFPKHNEEIMVNQSIPLVQLKKTPLWYGILRTALRHR